MGTYLMSQCRDEFLSSGTDLSMLVLALVEKWRPTQWREIDAAAQKAEQEELAAAKCDDPGWWTTPTRDPNLLNIEIFRKAQAEIPRELDKFVMWAKENLDGTILYKIGMMFGERKLNDQQFELAHQVIDKAVRLGQDVYIS